MEESVVNPSILNAIFRLWSADLLAGGEESKIDLRDEKKRRSAKERF